MKNLHLGVAFLLASSPTLAASPTKKTSSQAAQRPPPCQHGAPERSNYPQGTPLWGTTPLAPEKERSSVLAALKLHGVRRLGAPLAHVRLEQGRLVAPSLSPQQLVGATLQGLTSDNQPVDVALCDVASDSASLTWYRIERWNAETASWENPCVATPDAPEPRALAVPGVWDFTGARSDTPGRFTFACEGGVIAKCVTWGYKPWATHAGQPLAELHQACTRMARADYCGDGRSHTRSGTRIDMYDALGVQKRTTTASATWRPEEASFEAAWGSEGASCLARTREGQPVESILAECPGHFEPASLSLGDGDVCSLRRKGSDAASLRNRSYEPTQLTHQSP
jgi:hypothetical protein